MPSLSPNLRRIVDFANLEPDHELDLSPLARQIVELFPDNAQALRALLGKPAGRMKLGTLGIHLLQIIKDDSAVRDFQTTGHLAKFLSRLDVFRRTSDYRLIGLPNPIFDEISQTERARYFESGVSLEIDAEVFESAAAQEIMKRETEVLSRVSSRDGSGRSARSGRRGRA